MKTFARCSAIAVDGAEVYIAAVMKHLEKITTLRSGMALLQNIQRTGKNVKIVMADTGGNAASVETASSPLLVQAINTQNAQMFQNDLKVSLDNAKKAGVQPDFIAQQLTEGLTPVTYSAAKNVVQPASKVKTPAGAAGPTVMAMHANAAMQKLGWLQDFANGTLKVSQLPTSWKADLPRILRPWLTQGRGANTTVWFDPADWKPCALDPAMKGRHPSLGLVHELIHAWHSTTGRAMQVRKGAENLEEVITTGLPPFNFEEFSDNKFRAEFGPEVNLRTKY